jgi:hypothetical protein
LGSLSTDAIFRHPSILRNLICPLATRLKSRISAVSSFGREPASEFLVEPLDHVGGAEGLPLRLGEVEEREELVAAFPQARHHARAALGPVALEGCVRGTGRVVIGRVDDAVEVVADLGKRMLGRFALEVTQLVDTAALDRGPASHQPDRASQPGITVDDAEHRRPQPARDEIVEAALPRRERLACAQLQGE